VPLDKPSASSGDMGRTAMNSPAVATGQSDRGGFLLEAPIDGTPLGHCDAAFDFAELYV